MRLIDLTGQKFSRLTVLEYLGNSHWKCKCDCGTVRAFLAPSLKNGNTKSCGCYRVERCREHGATAQLRHGQGRGNGTAEYRCWGQMLTRCRNPKSVNYPRYGARGITVCERWLTFENFFADVGPRPSDAHSIDRIDVNGNYEPSNVRWATTTQQNRNTTFNRKITIDGVQKPLSEWLVDYGTNRKTFYNRLRAGMSEQEAITLRPTPRGKYLRKSKLSVSE